MTERQRELLDFIALYYATQLAMPRFSDMQSAMRAPYKSNLHWLITELEHRGYIRRIYGLQQAIEIIRFPAEARRHIRTMPDGSYFLSPLAIQMLAGRDETAVRRYEAIGT